MAILSPISRFGLSCSLEPQIQCHSSVRHREGYGTRVWKPHVYNVPYSMYPQAYMLNNPCFVFDSTVS